MVWCFKRRRAGSNKGGISNKAWKIYAAKNLWKFHLFKYQLCRVKIPVIGTVTTSTVKRRKNSRGSGINPRTGNMKLMIMPKTSVKRLLREEHKA